MLVKANKFLSHIIQALLCPGDANHRKARASLNKRLKDKGHLLEPLICQKKKKFDEVNFVKSNKGALTLFTKLIEKAGLRGKRLAIQVKRSGAVRKYRK